MADPTSGRLRIDDLQALNSDPPIEEVPPSLDEVREVLTRLKGGKASDVCSINAELAKAGGEAVTRGLHAVWLPFGYLVPFLSLR